jgi:uncharacterized protein YciU (UPF0263 family)
MKVDSIANLLNEFDDAFSDILAGRTAKRDDAFSDVFAAQLETKAKEENTNNDFAEVVTLPVDTKDVNDEFMNLLIAETDAKNTLLAILDKIYLTANKISAERYMKNFNTEIALANLINVILCETSDGANAGDDFFELLNNERKVPLPDALSEFDFYKNNPYKAKAEKILSKIEARKNRA